MATAIILLQLAIVLALIFIGARVGGIGLGIYGSIPSIRPSFMLDGEMHRVSMPEIIEIIMMSVAALILLVGFHYYHRIYRNRLLNHSVPISPNVICGNGLYRTFSSTIEVPMLNL